MSFTPKDTAEIIKQIRKSFLVLKRYWKKAQPLCQPVGQQAGRAVVHFQKIPKTFSHLRISPFSLIALLLFCCHSVCAYSLFGFPSRFIFVFSSSSSLIVILVVFLVIWFSDNPAPSFGLLNANVNTAGFSAELSSVIGTSTYLINSNGKNVRVPCLCV